MGHQFMGELEQEKTETVHIRCVVCVDVEVDDEWGELESGAEGTILETTNLSRLLLRDFSEERMVVEG